MQTINNIHSDKTGFNLSIIKLMGHADPTFVVPLTVAVDQFQLLPDETLAYVQSCTGQSIESILAKTAAQLDCDYIFTDNFNWSFKNKNSILAVKAGNVIVSVEDSTSLAVITSLVQYALVTVGGYPRGFSFNLLPLNDYANILLTPHLQRHEAGEVLRQVEKYLADGGTPKRKDTTRLIEATNLKSTEFKLVLVDQ